jgi:hypothetical protein
VEIRFPKLVAIWSSRVSRFARVSCPQESALSLRPAPIVDGVRGVNQVRLMYEPT